MTEANAAQRWLSVTNANPAQANSAEHLLKTLRPKIQTWSSFSIILSRLDHTHQSDEEEEDLEAPAERGHAGDVSVTHRGHGHHQEVHAVPVGQALAVLEVRRVAGILQLWRGNDQNDKWSHLGSDGWELMEQIKL